MAAQVCLTSCSSMYLLSGFQMDALIDALPKTTVMMGVPTSRARLFVDPCLTGQMRLFISSSASPFAQDPSGL